MKHERYDLGYLMMALEGAGFSSMPFKSYRMSKVIDGGSEQDAFLRALRNADVLVVDVAHVAQNF